jgi:transcriptional regulator with GAF, ATPase, and Fis domain
MLAVNCAALPEGLLESELFGHEKGAFTGAVRRHAGKFEQAHHGTLMLDEIGEIPLSTQVRLLRVLQSGELQRVGGQETVRVDVRVIAATNRDLREEVRVGRFREDLFYRLNVFHIEVPALRERPEDIPSLAMHFLRRYATKHRRPATHISPALMLRLQQWRWPGNVRELEHAIERAVLVEPSEELQEVGIPDDLHAVEPSPPGADFAGAATGAGPSSVAAAPPNRSGAAAPGDPKPPLSATLPEALDEVERRLILDALEQEGGVQARAAKRLGLSRSNLHYRMQRLGIQRLGVLFG